MAVFVIGRTVNFYSKLGITDYAWESQPDGIPEGGARMDMRPRDMLKVGVTYLNNGVWAGEQVIPTQWVEEVFNRSSAQVLPARSTIAIFSGIERLMVYLIFQLKVMAGNLLIYSQSKIW